MVFLAVVLVLVSGSISGVLWWMDRPLAEIDARIEAHEYRDAWNLAQTFERRQGPSTRFLVLKAEALAGLGRWAEAVAIFNQVGSNTVRAHRAYATALLHLSQWSRAEGVLVLLLGQIGENEDALHELTVCRIQLGRYAEALESANRAAEIPGNRARGLVLVGEIHRIQKNVPSAIKAWKEVLELRPNAEDLQVRPDEFFAMSGSVLLEGGHPEAARDLLIRSLRERPSAESLVGLGKASLQLGDVAKAEAAWKKAVEIEHLNHDAREELANAALGRGSPREALDWLAALIEVHAERSSTAYEMQRAYRLLKQDGLAVEWQRRGEELRKAEKRKSAIEQALIEAPRSFWSRFILAHRFASAGNWSEAEVVAAGLIKEDAKDPLVRDLANAIRERGPLPSLDRLPIHQF